MTVGAGDDVEPARDGDGGTAGTAGREAGASGVDEGEVAGAETEACDGTT
jgi:hypothetical protein